MFDEYGLDILWVNILPTGQDHVFLAVDNVQVALLIDVTDVAGAQPLDTVRVDEHRFRGGILAVPVPRHGDAPPGHDFTCMASGHDSLGQSV